MKDKWYLNNSKECNDFMCDKEICGSKVCVAIDCKYCLIKGCRSCGHIEECTQELLENCEVVKEK